MPLLTPEYLFRPRQLLQRVRFHPSAVPVALSLPWGTITATSNEVIGRSIATQGIYDLPLTEALFRLSEPGETMIDVGANIGYTSLVLALAAGRTGRVICFEPNADVLVALNRNVRNWATLPIAPIEVNSFALSNRDGEALLGFPEDYSQNCGVASLEIPGTVSVRVGRLDSLEIGRVGVMKIDVEGHEAVVFAGAEQMLSQRKIRDILFEENLPYPAPSHQILLAHGYRIFRLTRSTWKPLLLSVEAPPRQAYLPSNFLATADPARALNRFQARGWRSLTRKPLV